MDKTFTFCHQAYDCNDSIMKKLPYIIHATFVVIEILKDLKRPNEWNIISNAGFMATAVVQNDSRFTSEIDIYLIC